MAASIPGSIPMTTLVNFSQHVSKIYKSRMFKCWYLQSKLLILVVVSSHYLKIMLSRFVLSNSIKIKLYLFWSKLLTCLCLSELRCCLAKIAVSKLSILYYVSMYVTYYSIVIQRRTYEFDGSTRLDQGRVFVIKNWPDQWTHRIFFYISTSIDKEKPWFQEGATAIPL